MKRIFSSHNLAAVFHLRNLLQAEGIPAVVKNEYLSSAMGDLPPAECQAELWLLSDSDLWRAERLLHSPPPAGPGWTCGCGEVLGEQFTQCWHCHAYRA